MDITVFPSLQNFIINSKLRYEDDVVWLGTMELNNAKYRATYREKNDALELKNGMNTLIFTPIKVLDMQFRYMVIIDVLKNTTLYSMDTLSGDIVEEEIEVTKHGFHFK
jgi:hypothetical protein